MTEILKDLDAITDRVLAYRPKGKGEAAAKVRKQIDAEMSTKLGVMASAMASEILRQSGGPLDVEGVARAGLVAIREVTPDQVIAGQDALDACIDCGWDSGPDGEGCNNYTTILPSAPAEVWRAMIDKLLGEPK